MPFHKKIYYELTGDADSPAVLFLHGFLGHSQSWHKVIEPFEKNFLCIAVDLPGHGRSLTVNEAIFAMPGCADAVVGILEENRIDKMHLVGYSMGGRLALYLGLKHPEKVNKLVLESASPGLKTESEQKKRNLADNALAERLQSQPLEKFLEDWYQQPLFESLRQDKERYKELLEQRRQNDPAGLAKSLRCMGTGVQPSLWEGLTGLKCQTLLIVGDNDYKFKQIASEMAAQNKRIQTAIMRESGHNVHFEQPEQYAKKLKSFLSED